MDFVWTGVKSAMCNFHYQFLHFFRLESEKAQAVATAKAQFTRELAEATHRQEEEHGHQLEKLKQERLQVHINPSKEEWEREKERAVDEAVKQARKKWLEEKEK